MTKEAVGEASYVGEDDLAHALEMVRHALILDDLDGGEAYRKVASSQVEASCP